MLFGKATIAMKQLIFPMSALQVGKNNGNDIASMLRRVFVRNHLHVCKMCPTYMFISI